MAMLNKQRVYKLYLSQYWFTGSLGKWFLKRGGMVIQSNLVPKYILSHCIIPELIYKGSA